MHAARPLTISDWVPPILAARPLTKSHPTPAKRPATTCLTEQSRPATEGDASQLITRGRQELRTDNPSD